MFFLFLIFVFSVFSTAYAIEWQFARTLQIGARGPDVFALQKFLNENQKTRVAEVGAGSRGKETNYFGPATARAVTAFQKQNAITGEAGRVGTVTLGVLNKNIPHPSGTPLEGGFRKSPLEGSTPTPVGGRDVSEKVKTTNPNARNLDQFLNTIKQVGEVQGYTTDKLETLTKEVSAYALGTTTDFFAQFVKESNKDARSAFIKSSLWNHLVASLEKITNIFASRADAQAPSFGGMVVYVFPCTCSGNWLMGMVPLSVPPIVLMTHYSGSQAFANFNAPFTLFLLGNYIPQGAPCLFYVGLACTTLPSQAQTSPVLGSS